MRDRLPVRAVEPDGSGGQRRSAAFSGGQRRAAAGRGGEGGGGPGGGAEGRRQRLKPITPKFSIARFFFNDTATTEISTLSLHDALPISARARLGSLTSRADRDARQAAGPGGRT